MAFHKRYGSTVSQPQRESSKDGLTVVDVLELPFFFFNINKKLSNALQCQFVAFDEDADRIVHEFARHVQHGGRQRRTDQHHLRRCRQEAVYVVDLFLEATIEHFVRLVEDHRLKVGGRQGIATDQIVDASWRAGHNLDPTLFQQLEIGAEGLATNATMTLHVHIVPERLDDLLGLFGQFSRGRHNEDLTFAAVL